MTCDQINATVSRAVLVAFLSMGALFLLFMAALIVIMTGILAIIVEMVVLGTGSVLEPAGLAICVAGGAYMTYIAVGAAFGLLDICSDIWGQIHGGTE